MREGQGGAVVDIVAWAQAPASGVRVIALDGYSASGKSTLAATLGGSLDAAIVHGDDFYRDVPASDRAALSPVEGVDRYFDWQRLRDEALVPLRAGRRARFRAFDWVAGRGLTSHAIIVEPRPIVIVDGVYSARPELTTLVDLAVVVETPTAERAARRARRHDHGEWEARWDAAERIYFATIRPPSTFEIVVPGFAH